MKDQGTTLSLKTRGQDKSLQKTFAKSLQKNKAPYHPIHTPSTIVSDRAVPKAVPNFSADISQNYNIADYDLENFDISNLSLELLPDAAPRQFLRNHLILCRQYGIKYDGIGCIVKTIADELIYDSNYDISQDVLNYEPAHKHTVVQYNSHQNFEFLGTQVSINGITQSFVDEAHKKDAPYEINLFGSNSGLGPEFEHPTIQIYRTVEEIPVFVLSKNGFYDKVFFDAGNNISAYLNFLFTSPDLVNHKNLARDVALQLVDDGIWDLSELSITFLNPDITSYKELINAYITQQNEHQDGPVYSFYFLQQNKKAFLFFGEIIDQCDHDFRAATQFNEPVPLKPVNQSYVDQVVFHIHEDFYAVMTHTYSRNPDNKWNETIDVVHSENMVDILQSIQDQDLRDQFMNYLRINKVKSKFVVKRDNNADLEFVGSLIGFASNRKFPEPQDQGEVKPNTPSTRWTVLSLYLTKGGSYVCHQANHSINPGEHDKLDASVTKEKEEVSKFFGFRWLAKKLYESANFNANEVID